MFVDSHCHLDFEQFDRDREEVLARVEKDLHWAVVVGVDLEHFPRITKLIENNKKLYCSVGIHPNHEVTHEASAEKLVQLAQHPRCVAMGETGMDFFRDHVSQDLQTARFRTHLQAANKAHKPVIVHMRQADEPTLQILAEENVQACGGVMHCFSSTVDVARRALDMGMYISFSGNITFKNSVELREVVKFAPQDRFMIETDSPFLAPVPKRGKRNEPSYVQYVAQCVAETRQMTLEDVGAISTKNAATLFKVTQ
ncbi:MAG: TatD family hydrolase [Mariprofundaceae bacterium]|nr:TatD family hydrolase [Mariprofundaceae bacterium]